MELTAAVLGTGYMGKRHLEILKKLGLRIVICGRDEELGKQLAQEYSASFYTDYKEMLAAEKPDMVSVCLPTSLHFEAVKESLLSGSAVLCEKPFTETAAQAAELCRIAKERGKLLMVGHPLRFTPAYGYLKACIADNRFGKLKQLHLFRHSECPAWSTGDWLMNIEKSGGAAKDMHIHESDIVNYLLGLPASVTTTGERMSCTTVYRYDDQSAAVSASVSWRNVKGYPFNAGYDAVFEHAAVEASTGGVKLYTDNNICNPLETEELPAHCSGDLGLANEITYFVDCLKKEKAPLECMPEDTLAAMQLNEIELSSLNLGCEVPVQVQ